MNITAARQYVQQFLGGMDISSLDDLTVIDFIKTSYPGGAEAFDERYPLAHMEHSWLSDKPRPVTTMQRRARAQRMTGFRVKPHEEVIDVEFDAGDDEYYKSESIKVLMSVVDSEERGRRTRINRSGKKLMEFHRTGLIWVLKHQITVWDDDVTFDFHKWGRISTIEYTASQREQFQTCYRPGTSRTPLQGPAARLGISDKEYWSNETYPKFSSKSNKTNPSNKKEN